MTHANSPVPGATSRFTDLFIKRPVVALVVSLVILLAGLQSIRSLNVRQYPRSDLAKISVTTAYIGANADLVRGFVTTPLERVIASTDGIDFMESASSQGLSRITVFLKLNQDTNAALTQVQSKIAQVRNDLPPEAEAPVVNIETSDNQFASMYLSFYSDKLDQNQITDYLTRVVQPRLSAISGVEKADILGARTFAMRVWLKPDAMASLGISPTDVRVALGSNNYLSAVGAVKGSMVSVNLVANTDLRSVEEFRNLVVKEQSGTVVRLGEIADVSLGAESYDEDVRFDGQQATFMGIWVLPTANALDVIKAVRDTMPEIRAALPAGMSAGIPYDATAYINDALHEVIKTLAETLVIVVIVIFLFLGSFRSVLVPVVAIPISLIGGVFLMLLMGFTINLLTLLAIVLAVGLVVDDAIVVVENVERHMQEGMSPFDAAILSARELFSPIVAMTITLAAVYAPIGLQGGLTGALFREFAFTLAGAVMISGVVAVTLSPMMASRLLKQGASQRGMAAWVNRRFAKLKVLYRKVVELTLRNRAVTLTAAGFIMILAVPFAMFSLDELAPKEDQGIVFGIVLASPNSTIDQTTLYTEKVYEVFKDFPETANTFQLTQPTFGFSGMVTKPWSERGKSTETLLLEASEKLAAIPGVQVIATTPDPLPGAGDFPLEFVIASTDEPDTIVGFADQLVGAAFGSGVFMFAQSDLKYDLPQSSIVFDRDKVNAMGLNLSLVGADLATFLGGDFVNRFSMLGRSYKVIPQVKRSSRLNTDQLGDLHVSGPNGVLVPLSTFATVETSTQPRQLNRFQQLNSAKIQGAYPPGVTLDMALQALEKKAAEILPKGYRIDYAGAARQLRQEGGKFLPTLGLALIMIYLVLAAQFNSFRDPFIILGGSVPLALTGALFFCFMGFTTLNIYSRVGLVTLVGLVAKNGILLVEFANTRQEQGFSKLAAIVDSAVTRLRPILMTSVATVVGHFPLVIATGPGAGARNSIGLTLVTGMAIGTIFTLIVLPAIYMLIAKNHGGTRTMEAEETNPKPVPSTLATA